MYLFVSSSVQSCTVVYIQMDQLSTGLVDKYLLLVPCDWDTRTTNVHLQSVLAWFLTCE